MWNIEIYAHREGLHIEKNRTNSVQCRERVINYNVSRFYDTTFIEQAQRTKASEWTSKLFILKVCISMQKEITEMRYLK